MAKGDWMDQIGNYGILLSKINLRVGKKKTPIGKSLLNAITKIFAIEIEDVLHNSVNII